MSYQGNNTPDSGYSAMIPPIPSNVFLDLMLPSDYLSGDVSCGVSIDYKTPSIVFPNSEHTILQKIVIHPV